MGGRVVAAAVSTFVATLAFAPNIQNGIVTGIMLSLGLLLYRMMRPHVAALGRHQYGTLHDAGRHGLEPLHPKFGARSFAFPDERLAKLWPPEVLLMLGTIEQSDDSDFRDDPKRTAEAVAIEYAPNREPFYHANSSADAIGPYQFTDRWEGSRPCTYSTVVRRCAEAQLSLSFEHAARDLKNSVQAAVCLLDLERARMPEDALLLFREDYWPAYPVAAYNAGGGQSARLCENLPPDALPDAALSLDLPVNAFKFRRVLAHRKKHARTHAIVIVDDEMRAYLPKMFTTWGIVDDWLVRGDGSAAAKPASAESM